MAFSQNPKSLFQVQDTLLSFIVLGHYITLLLKILFSKQVQNLVALAKRFAMLYQGPKSYT
jgi:hypothetical protein